MAWGNEARPRPRPRSRPSGGRQRLFSLGAPAAVLALTVGLGSGAVGAQETGDDHPAHIHAGTCAELGDVVFPLSNVTAGGAMAAMAAMTGSPEAGAGAAMGEAMGPDSAIPVESSYTVVDADLATIVEGGHAINVHLSEDEIGTYIACGDIGGSLMPGMAGEGGLLLVGLGALNDSGHTGVAALQEMGEQTGVTVFLVASDGAGAAGTPAAAADPTAEEAAVAIVDFAFEPTETTIPVGGSVTWTNEASAPHTATGFEGADFQSGTLTQGETFTETFDEAGTYQYRCEFHASMLATVVVE